MDFAVYAYKLGSDSASKIADGLDCFIVKPDGKFQPKQDTVIINWGNSNPPSTWKENKLLLNHWDAVKTASNKLGSFQKFKENNVSSPEFTTDKATAQLWKSKGITFFARHKLTGHSGEGIEVVQKNNEVPDAPLYVKYIKKIREYRIHVFQDAVIDIQEKKKKIEAKADFMIRSHDNGWVFARGHFSEGDYEYLEKGSAGTLAIDAVRALGLDFGAVDVVYNGHLDKYYALEVNTAPGIEGETMFSYVSAFLSFRESL